jgi:hypothetical protein
VRVGDNTALMLDLDGLAATPPITVARRGDRVEDIPFATWDTF